MTYSVRLEPIGVDMEVEDDETVLQAAFRQGITLMHGCKEGQCSACKSQLLAGDAEHGDYSTFALSDIEQSDGKVLLCRLYPSSDLEIELLNYDEEALADWIPAKKFKGAISRIEALTHDIRLLDIELEEPMTFKAGQYADLTLVEARVTRAYSMANPPRESGTLSFLIKIYTQGAFSDQLAKNLRIGDALEINGPFGTSFRNPRHSGATLLVGGGSGLAPLWSILNDLAETDPHRTVRLFYGARARQDLFYLAEIAALGAKFADFAFIPALSEPQPGDEWTGETGFIHEVVARHFAGASRDQQWEAYACGPPPMVDAVLPVCRALGISADDIHLDKFTPAS